MSLELTEKTQRRTANRERMGGLYLAEEAIAFLRVHGRGPLLIYGLGTVPFVFLLVLLTGLMLHGLYAHLYLGMSTLALTFLYFGMKWAQYCYMRKLYVALRGDVAAEDAPTDQGRFRAFVYQSITHTLGLLALPFMVFLLLPIPWYVGFLNTVMVLDNERFPSLKALWTETYKNIAIWPRQHFMLFWLLSPLAPILLVVPIYTLMPVLTAVDDYVIYSILMIYVTLGAMGIFFVAPIASMVFANIVSGVMLVLTLLVAFSGVETREMFFTMLFSDTTFWLTCVGLCYLVMDPVLKCAYVLRGFHAQSLKTGDDLRAAIMRIRKNQASQAHIVGASLQQPATSQSSSYRTSSHISSLLLIAMACLVFPVGRAAAAEGESTAISAEALEVSVQDTLSQQRYAWRLPREIDNAEQENPVYAVLRQFFSYASSVYRSIMDFVDEIMERLGRNLPFSSSEATEVSWYTQLGLRVLIIAIVVVLIWLLVKMIRKKLRERKQKAVEMPSLSLVMPDIHSEEVHAGDLPEENWLGLARDLAQRRDYRAAIRAVYLGMLAALAERELVRLARYKSNREYLRELQRRIRQESQLLTAFKEGIHTVEAVWYGGYTAEQDQFQQMLQLYKQVTAHG